MSYKQKPVKDDPLPLSDKLVKLQAAYDRAGLEYVKSSADYREMEFLDAVQRRPDTHRKFITSLYRLKTPKKFVVGGESDEGLIYHIQETVQNHSDEYIVLDQHKGYWWNIDTRLNKNAQGHTAKVQVLGEFPVFEIPFSPAAVDRVCDESLLDVSQFYVGTANTRGPNVSTGDIYIIKNKDDFKNGTFDELMDMGRYNYSTNEPRLSKWREEGDLIKKQSQTITSLSEGAASSKGARRASAG
jgi:hypothetical protein